MVRLAADEGEPILCTHGSPPRALISAFEQVKGGRVPAQQPEPAHRPLYFPVEHRERLRHSNLLERKPLAVTRRVNRGAIGVPQASGWKTRLLRAT